MSLFQVYSGTSIIRTPLGPYLTALIIEVSLLQRLVTVFASHTYQLARLTCVTETTQTSKRRPKGGLTEGVISVPDILVSLTNHLHDDPCELQRYC